MRKTIILGSLLALVGFASIAQASDSWKLSDRDANRVHREVSDDTRGDRNGRYEGKDQSRERHDVTNEGQRESRESNERRDRH